MTFGSPTGSYCSFEVVDEIQNRLVLLSCKLAATGKTNNLDGDFRCPKKNKTGVPRPTAIRKPLEFLRKGQSEHHCVAKSIKLTRSSQAVMGHEFGKTIQ
jgi:hypothetical protein